MSKREDFLNRINYNPLSYPFGADELLLENEINEEKEFSKMEAKSKNTTKKKERIDRTYPFSAEEVLMRQEDAGLIH